jgi:hypothetical protein
MARGEPDGALDISDAGAWFAAPLCAAAGIRVSRLEDEPEGRQGTP